MRFVVRFRDRIGVAQDILGALSTRGIYLMASEVDQQHVYLDAPGVTHVELPAVVDALRSVPDVLEVEEVDLLPGARQRLHLEAILSAMADPVLAVDAHGVVTAASGLAQSVAGGAALVGRPLRELLDDAALHEELLGARFRVPAREVIFGGESFLLDASPIVEAPGAADGAPAGGVITLHAARRLGKRMTAIQAFASEGGFDAIIGTSPPIRALKARAARVAAVEAPLLVRGETGTGKELVAHACHSAGPRRDAPFLALNCAALPESLAESELFGYAPGAFTGAHRSGKPGLLELANNGTIFLDEVGEMSPYLQAKLLRFLNDGRFRRVGGDRELSVDVRVISATHRDLEAMVAARAFREDLFYRLNVVNLEVPPLRERGDDILLLAHHFLETASAQVQRPTRRLTPAAGTALLTDPWPGNVRQLHNVVFRAVTTSDRALLDVADLELAGSRVAAGRPGAEGAPASLQEALDQYERSLLERLYPLHPSTRRLAAALKTSHNAMAVRLRKYGIPARPGAPRRER
ncbi:MAG TPA: sigma 54-interacting transcriptional regulator [Anaeromyxobacteraceae bacterium]|nr:sigma 54-interacting transcriptional regulator [Anaeromyxobacteraceae bacterium]